MADRSQGETALVQFSERLTNSAAFGTLFREGMDLVEETAAYLDGDGRTEAKALERSVSLTYATESMRLTTRLMQLASWLLLHRAVKEGEMTLTQANREKTKVKLSAADPGPDDMIEKLPQQLQDLIARSMNLQGRVAASTPPSTRRHRTRADRQSAGAAAQPPEGGVRAVIPAFPSEVRELHSRAGLRARNDEWNKKRPGKPGRFAFLSRTEEVRNPHSFLRKPENFFWKRETRPPRSSSCWEPPVQAGCDLESMSRFSLSPSLPQVERVWYSVPSVMTTVIV